MILFWNCEETKEDELIDCAGIAGGSNICGCIDTLATNYDSTASYDDGSCEYLLNGIPIKWVQTYDISDNNELNESWKVIKSSDGGFLIAGASNYKGLLIKTDANGLKEWHKTYENSTSLYSVIESSDGGYVGVGYYECDTLPGCYPDMYILKTDFSGNIEWEKSDGTEENNELCECIPGPACTGMGNDEQASNPVCAGNGEGFVHVHRGIQKNGNLTGLEDWRNPMVRVIVD